MFIRRRKCDSEPVNMKAAKATSKPFDPSLLPPSHPLFDSCPHLRSIGRPPAPPPCVPSSLGVCYTTRQVFPVRESSIDQDFQALNPDLNSHQSSSEPYFATGCISFEGSVNTQRISHSDTQLPNVSSCNYFLPFWDQVRL